MFFVQVLLLLALAGLVPQEHQHGPATPRQLGTVTFDASCSAAAMPAFTRAVTLLHSFEFGAATEGFAAAFSTDPSCAMAQWGMSLSAWGNPFAAGIKPVAQLQHGREAAARGLAVPPRTPRERAYLDAVARLYTSFDSGSQRDRFLAYRDAMAALAAKYPDDTEAATFAALARAAAADVSDKTYADQLAAGAVLERLFAAQPNHPGLAHYIIHAYDFPPLAPRALDAARRYAKIAPAAPHALHMPSHTFTRVGSWQESIETNIASAETARRERSTSEELHAMDYLMYAYLQTAQDAAARRLLDGLPDVLARFDPRATGSPAPGTAGLFAAAAIPARYALERRAWAEAARLEPRSTEFPVADALTHFARAVGAARAGDPAAARGDLQVLAAIGDRLRQANEHYWAEQLDIQRQAASAWAAFADGQRDAALSQLRAAATVEDRTEKNAMTPGPLAPAREQLGEMLLEAGQPAAALAEFEKTLQKEPGRFNAIYGAARAAARGGDRAKAVGYYRELLRIGERADPGGRPALAEAREAVGASAALH